ncbi:MAG: ASCH domain-containing protein [Planctomycetaceae bacterium]
MVITRIQATREGWTSMADVLIYWRDFQRNRSPDTATRTTHRWHSNAGVLSELIAGDRLWLVTSGSAARCNPPTAGFLVDLWDVAQVIPNPGDDSDYPSDRYRYRVECTRAPEAPRSPIDVDDILRSDSQPAHLPIGKFLQGPRRLDPVRLDGLGQALSRPPAVVLDEDSQLLSEQQASPVSERRVTATTVTPQVKRSRQQETYGTSEMDRELVALGIRQPWAELILRGIKTIEVRTLETNHRGPIYLYASKELADTPAARAAIAQHGLDVDTLPRGLLLGTVEIVDCRIAERTDASAACLPATMLDDKKAWVVSSPQRLEVPVRPRFLPYGVWFYPFRRKRDDAAS